MAKKGELTQKQIDFCKWYVILNNATQAAIKAKYSESTAGSISVENMQKPLIKAEILRLKAINNKEYDLAAEKWNKEVSTLAQSDIQDFLTMDDTGTVTGKALSDMPRYATRCIKKIRQKRTIRQTNDKSGDILMDDTFEFELWDKNKALELWGRAEKRFDRESGAELPMPILIKAEDGSKIAILGYSSNGEKS